MFEIRPYIFIHVPKTAGSSITRALNIGEHCCHEPLSKYPSYLLKNVFSFTFVRNPYDRIFSAYNYLSQMRGNDADNAFASEHLSRYKNFNTFIKDFKKSETLQQWLHFRSVFDFIDGPIDFIGKYENLQHDFNVVCNIIGLPHTTLNHINSSAHGHYSQYYNSSSKKIVEKIFCRELDEFDYAFERLS